MKDQAVLLKYTGKVALPTIVLFFILLSGYTILIYGYKKGLSPILTSSIGSILAYGMFTIVHEASHRNISGGHKSFIKLEQALGWMSSFFLLFPFTAFVIIHLRHHAHTNDPIKDPDNYVNGKNGFSIFFRCLTLIGHYFGLTLGIDSKKDPAMRSIRYQSISFVIFLVAIISIIIAVGEGTTLFFVMILSALIAAPILAFSFDWIPHYPHDNLSEYHNTRVITIPGLELVSLYQSYHLIHHLYPRIPFYKYRSCFLDIEKKLQEKQSPVEGLRKHDLAILRKENTYTDVILGQQWKYVLQVQDVFEETHNAIKIVFENLENISFQFEAGQYVVVSTYVNKKQVSRCYSLCSDPATGKLSIGVKRVLNGKLSNHLLDAIKKGDKLTVSGPFGNFVLPRVLDKPLLLIAGGSGITPLLAILKTFLRGSNQKVTLLYGCKSSADVIFKEDLQELKAIYGARFDVLLTYEILDQDRQYRYLMSIAQDTLCYICGPNPMMNASRIALTNIGIPKDQIKIEEFSYTQQKRTGNEYKVAAHLQHQTISFSADSSETILEGSLRHQTELPYACASGQCGTCKIKLVEGEVVWQKNKSISLVQNEIDQGYILPCICSPKTNIKLVL